MPAADRVAKLLQAKADALVRRSAEDLAALLHPDFTYVNAGGFKFDKAGYIYFGCTSGKIVFSEQKFSDPSNFIPRDDHRRFAPEFNHFGDGLRVPPAKLPHYWVFILFLRFQLASDSGWALLIPVECALFPEINISHE